MGANGVSPAHGADHPEPGEADGQAGHDPRPQPHRGGDHSKLGATYFPRFGKLAKIDTLIADADADADESTNPAYRPV